MGIISTDPHILADESKAFDDTKAGVKGLVDAGITTIPSKFIHPKDEQGISFPTAPRGTFNVPVIDLTGVDDNATGRKRIVDEIRDAAATWGFFQVENHGIPVPVLEEMLEGIRMFFEQGDEVKKGYYSRDFSKKVTYFSNAFLHSESPGYWRDTIKLRMAPDPPSPEELPAPLREIMAKYSEQVIDLGKLLLGLLSEALGLQTSHLNEMGCGQGLFVAGHYSPSCPQPHLTQGISTHSDCDFMTVLLQDQVGGLQLLHEGQWVDVVPMHGALVVNIGDILQLLTNDKFKSVVHRVVAHSTKAPRISVASFFRNPHESLPTLYGPIKELISEGNPPKYREVTMKELYDHRIDKGLAGSVSSLTPFKL